MRKFLTLLFVCLLTSNAWGLDVVFDATTDLPPEVGTQSPFIIEKEGVTVSFSHGLANGSQYRLYKGQTLTICSNVGNIIKIVFECTAIGDAQYGPGNLVTDTGTFSYAEKIGVWEGCAQCVTFTAATNQVRFTRIIVTIESGGLSLPRISPAGGTYYAPVEVSITCPTTDATIHYTTNGANPTTASPVYDSPFIVNMTTTVKAISAKEGEVSEVVSATYEFIDDEDFYNSLEKAKSAPDGTLICFIHRVIVLAQCNRYLYVMDETGYALIYGETGQTYKTGDVIPPGFIMTKTTYSSEPEFYNPREFKPAVENVPVAPLVITPAMVGHSMFAHLVYFENVTISQVDGRNYVITDENGMQCPVYFGSMCVSAPTNLEGTFNVTAIIGSYGNENTVYQVLPVKIERTTPDPLIGFGDLPFIGNDPENPNPTVTMGYDATVLYQQGNYLYAKDETGFGMVYGNTGQTYHQGDVIPAGFGGNVTFYRCVYELNNPVNFQAPINHVDVIAEEITLDQIDEEHWAHYVVVRNVMIDPTRNVLMDGNGNEAPYYANTFGYILPPDLSRPHDIYGIVGAYFQDGKCIYQLLPINQPTPIIDLCCLTDLYDVPKGQVARFDCPLTVIYQNGNYLYIKDTCDNYGLMYGNIGNQFKNGDLIIGAASWTEYQNMIELSNLSGWEKIGETDPVEPVILPIEEVSMDMVHWFLGFENAELNDEEGIISDETEEMKVYNRFPIDTINHYIYQPYSVNQDGEINIADVNYIISIILSVFDPCNYLKLDHWTVAGFLALYRGEMEFQPIEVIQYYKAIVEGDVNGDGDVNIADVNNVIDLILFQ